MSPIDLIWCVSVFLWLAIPRSRPRIAVCLAARVSHRYRRVSLSFFSFFFSFCVFSSSFWLVLSLTGYLFPGVIQWLS